MRLPIHCYENTGQKKTGQRPVEFAELMIDITSFLSLITTVLMS